jgi:hypothetical protein
MYSYTDFDRQFVRLRAAQYRDQLERWQSGQLSTDEFRPLRLQNGWYVQRYAPMLRVAVPYGELSSAQLRVLATLARDYDRPSPELLAEAQATQDRIDTRAGSAPAARLKSGYAHFTTRQNVQFNWIPLERSADVMDLLASVHLHGIQTSGNCIRNITSDERAGIAVDEMADPRPFAEILRQWSTLHPEFAFLPRKFKIAITGAAEDRAATAWHDVGLHLVRNDAGELGFKVLVGGGMGRTPIIGTVVREFLPWNQIMNYLEAVVRVYNRWGRRDNLYKARIKILVKAEGQRYIDEVEAEYQQIILLRDGAPAHHSRGRAGPGAGQLCAAGAGQRRLRRRQGGAHPAGGGRRRRRIRPLAAAERGPAPQPRSARRDAVVQAPGPGARRRHGRPAGRRRRAGRPLQRRRGPRHPRPEPAAALGALRRVADLWRARAAGPGPPNIRPADRHDRLPRRRLLRAGQCPLAAAGRRDHRALPGPGRAARSGRDRPAHQRLHQLLRPPPQRPHRHPGRGQGRQASGTRSRWAARTARRCRAPRAPARWSAPRSRPPRCRT